MSLESKTNFYSKNASILSKNSSESTQPFFQKPSEQFLNDIEVLLLKAFVTGNIPFRFADNYYFKMLLKRLARCEITPPDRKKLSMLVPIQVALTDIVTLDEMNQNQIPMTLTLDGWTDTSGKSIYAV